MITPLQLFEKYSTKPVGQTFPASKNETDLERELVIRRIESGWGGYEVINWKGLPICNRGVYTRHELPKRIIYQDDILFDNGGLVLDIISGPFSVRDVFSLSHGILPMAFLIDRIEGNEVIKSWGRSITPEQKGKLYLDIKNTMYNNIFSDFYIDIREFLCSQEYYLYCSLGDRIDTTKTKKKVVVHKVKVYDLDWYNVRFKTVDRKNGRYSYFEINTTVEDYWKIALSEDMLQFQFEWIKKRLMISSNQEVRCMRNRISTLERKKQELEKKIEDLEDSMLYEEERINYILGLDDDGKIIRA